MGQENWLRALQKKLTETGIICMLDMLSQGPGAWIQYSLWESRSSGKSTFIITVISQGRSSKHLHGL